MTRLLCVVACVLCVAVPGLAESPDRSQPPPVGEPRPFELPELQTFELSNGLRVLLLEKHQVPIVQTNLLVEAGRVREGAGQYGLADLTGDMLDEGAGDLSALDLAEAFTFLGAQFNISTGAHTTTVSVHVPSARFEQALGLMSDVVLRPALDGKELDRVRVERLTTLLSNHDEPRVIARVMYDRTLFGEAHPYGRDNLGNETFLRGVTTEDIRAFHDTFYRPNNAALIVGGDVDKKQAKKQLEKAFAEWAAKDVPKPIVPMVSQVSGRTVYLVDKPGAAQSVIRMGRLGAARKTPDYYALEVMNTMLGGAFTSRLNQNLREDKGYTYGAFSRFSYGRFTGPFTASASVETGVTGASLTEFMKELNGIDQPVPEEELNRSRNYLAMRFPQGFMAVSSVTDRVQDLVLYDLPPDTYDHYVVGVLGISQDDVTRVVDEYIDPENMAIVVVGDRSVIEDQIRELNLGEIKVFTVADVLGTPPDLSK